MLDRLVILIGSRWERSPEAGAWLNSHRIHWPRAGRHWGPTNRRCSQTQGDLVRPLDMCKVASKNSLSLWDQNNHAWLGFYGQQTELVHDNGTCLHNHLNLLIWNIYQYGRQFVERFYILNSVKSWQLSLTYTFGAYLSTEFYEC